METHPSSHLALEQPLLQLEHGRVRKFGGDGALVSMDVLGFLLKDLLFEIHKHAIACPRNLDRTRLVTVLLSNILTRFSPKPGEVVAGEPSKYRNRATSGHCELQPNGVIDWFDGERPGAALIVKEEEDKDWPGCMYEALSRTGVAVAIRNASARKLRKVYCVVHGNGWWGSAEIHPLGYVMVLPPGRILSSSVPHFRRHLQTKIQEQKVAGERSSSKGELIAADICKRFPDDDSLLAELKERVSVRVEAAARDLNAKLVFNKVVHGKEIDHSFSTTMEKRKLLLFGTAVCDSVVYESSILRFPVTRKACCHDSVLLSGLLRMFFGNRVLYWTLLGIQELVAVRDKEIQEEVDAALSLTGDRKKLFDVQETSL